MMRSIISARIGVLALAAPLFLAAPAIAQADHGKAKKGKRGATAVVVDKHGASLPVYVNKRGVASGTHSAYYPRTSNRYNQYVSGQSYREVERLQRRAVRACRRAIRDQAYHIGFHDVDFERGRYVDQIGPRRFRVTFREVEFEGRRRDWDRQVTCTVRRGDIVKRIDGIPEPRRRAHYRSSGYYR